MRSQYAPKPTVKILKRPDRNLQGDGSLLNGEKPKQPIKSLQQVWISLLYYTKKVMKTLLVAILFRENKSMQKQEEEYWEKTRALRRK